MCKSLMCVIVWVCGCVIVGVCGCGCGCACACALVCETIEAVGADLTFAARKLIFTMEIIIYIRNWTWVLNLTS
jgi:hypothetical protein